MKGEIRWKVKKKKLRNFRSKDPQTPVQPVGLTMGSVFRSRNI